MHLQNVGLDIVTSAAATWQLQFGAGPFINQLVGNFLFRFSKQHHSWAGQASNSPHFANAKRCTSPYWTQRNS